MKAEPVGYICGRPVLAEWSPDNVMNSWMLALVSAHSSHILDLYMLLTISFF
jgi:hypothetical protein